MNIFSLLRMLIGLLVLAIWAWEAGLVQGAPADSVVQLTSAGGSGTVIATGPGRTLILSCGHCFPTGKLAKLEINAPDPLPGGVRGQGKPRLLGVDHQVDLSLLEIPTGPLPFVCPVAPPGHVPGRLLSVGYDRMKWPAQQRPATILAGGPQVRGGRLTRSQWIEDLQLCAGFADPDTSTYTRELPYHGRSGGGLLDMDAGVLIGVVSGYMGASPQNWSETRPGACGVYVSHTAILRFLARCGQGGGMEQAPAPQPPMQPGRPWVEDYREPRQQQTQPYYQPSQPYCPDGQCPGGICPLPGGR